MHIALLTDGITPYVTGGMQRHSFHLARHLLRLGTKITLVHCVWEAEDLPSSSEVTDLLEAGPGQLRVLGFVFPKGPRVPGHYLKKSYRYSCEVYDAIHALLPEFDFVYSKGFSAWRLMERKRDGEHFCPVGVKFHGYEMFQPVKGIKRRMEQQMLRPPTVFINRLADAVFSYGGAITDLIVSLGVAREKITEIGSGIDDDWLLDTPSPSKGKRKFLFVGRYEKRKGIEDLMAVSDVLISGDIEFHWVGPLPQNKRIDADNMVYHGEIKDSGRLKEIIDSCDILTVPSHAEGMPNVILEAMSRGLAVMATEVGAVPIMVSEENGWLLAPGDRGALRDALKMAIAMPDDALLEMKIAGIAKVREKFLWSSVAQQTLEAIKKITFTT